MFFGTSMNVLTRGSMYGECGDNIGDVSSCGDAEFFAERDFLGKAVFFCETAFFFGLDEADPSQIFKISHSLTAKRYTALSALIAEESRPLLPQTQYNDLDHPIKFAVSDGFVTTTPFLQYSRL